MSADGKSHAFGDGLCISSRYTKNPLSNVPLHEAGSSVAGPEIIQLLPNEYPEIETLDIRVLSGRDVKLTSTL
jgi:hypothetical protein